MTSVQLSIHTVFLSL